MRVILATTCKGRLPHLSQTLPKNLKDLNGHPDASIVLLDYNDQDGLGDFIQREHSNDLDSGRLVYYRNNEPPRFEMAPAKNQAHRCALVEGADIIVNVDADNFTQEGFAAYVEKRFREADEEQEAIFLGARANHRGPGGLTGLRTPRGTFGRIGVTKQSFHQVGGYDEVFKAWSADDRDFAARVARLGYGWRQIHPRFLASIKHSDAMRFQSQTTESGDYFDEAAVLLEREQQQLRVVNGGRIGCGIVHRNFSSEPIEIKPLPTRVFGIGAQKTGTTSLSRAFQMLGYDSAHFANPHWAHYIRNEMKAEGKSRTLEMHTALSDLPIPTFFKELDAGYPGSKFVLTIRDEDSWIESVKVHWRALRKSWDDFSNEAHRDFYGTEDFDEAVFRDRYQRHNAEVVEHFMGRPDDLLVIHVNGKTRMPALCRFLNLPIWDCPFPHRHKTAEQQKYRSAL